MVGLLRTEVQGHLFQKAVELSDHDMMLLADHMPAPWGDELAGEVLVRLPLNLAKARYYDYFSQRLLKAAGAALPATTALQALPASSLPFPSAPTPRSFWSDAARSSSGAVKARIARKAAPGAFMVTICYARRIGISAGSRRIG